MVRWKRGIASQGLRQAVDYALGGSCDATLGTPAGIARALGYAPETVTRFIVENEQVTLDQLDRQKLAAWVAGRDPDTEVIRGIRNPSPRADLLLDATINSSKSFSIAAILDPDVAAAYDVLQDRLRERIILAWQRELNARRGKAGHRRMPLTRIEIVELRHARSRALDPHQHRHLWLNIKVLGEDGRWSNIDSRVALRFQTIINAEGDLAARTDPEWIAALARRGFSIGDDGEIEQLAHIVRPLSKRSRQIERNRANRLEEWRLEHPDVEPTPQDLTAIDQWAYAHERPAKPPAIDEADWLNLVRDEIIELDPRLAERRAAVAPVASSLDNLNVDLLARRAVVDADRRSTPSGGRFSRFDIRAGVLRAVAATGVVADRSQLEPLIEQVIQRAVDEGCTDLLGADEVPPQVKGYLSSHTATLKREVERRMVELASPGRSLTEEAVLRAERASLPAGRSLDEGQRAAVAALAGSDRLVTVTGPAGTGKTTMLRIACDLLRRNGRRPLLLAPTRKAAQVACAETGADAMSVHEMLRAHGWTWKTDDAGRDVWTWERPINPMARCYRLRRNDRVIVDEAGMLDLEAARALCITAEQTGIDLAFVGDPMQLRPVGHSGAMLLATEAATARVDLEDVHRFREPDGAIDRAYAQLTIALRDARSEDDRLAVADGLIAGGHVVELEPGQDPTAYLAERYLADTAAGLRVALVTAMNEEAQRINDTIQRLRLSRGELQPGSVLFAQDSQSIYEGDLVQSRANQKNLGVSNRQLWRVRSIAGGHASLESASDPGRVRNVPASYVTEHVHLAYASTAHGAQGETADVSYTSGAVNGAAVYVGLTRGKFQNTLVLPPRVFELREQIAELLALGASEPTVDLGTKAARLDLARAAARIDSLEVSL
ncbi:AAA family ATPase [Plantibacter sp. CFBP 8804]|uniref:AAA family ATPase n=1 Tax=Plantibacter sp. CFBP 8804 TaxID=2775270 RepID=UPI0017806A60|nr:AAA family ATPase [Plantibacter sp. CFBP 8804]MBD8518619.1 AAA family ATPase [Plantibacter sp. CFBP 8804]